MYDVNFFINKFQTIPDELWCSDFFVNIDGKSCALGLCGARCSWQDTEESKALVHLFDKWFKDKPGYYKFSVGNINDGRCWEFRQETQRLRILAALHDIKAMQALKDAEQIIEETKLKPKYKYHETTQTLSTCTTLDFVLQEE